MKIHLREMLINQVNRGYYPHRRIQNPMKYLKESNMQKLSTPKSCY